MNIKDEKGSITLFVVIAMFAFVLFSLATYTLLSRRNQTQQDLLSEIKKMYENDSEYEKYASYFGKEIVPIYNAEDLKEVASGKKIAISKENGKIYNFSENATYVLKNDINLSAVCNEDENWVPIGTESKPFSGFFEGMGYKISDVKINYADSAQRYQGLFGVIDGGIISNLEVDGKITSNEDYIGGFVGKATGKYTIRNCVNKISVTGNNYVGGIIGGDGDSENTGRIINCENHGIITGKNNVGGIIGNSNGNIMNVANVAKITGEENVRWNSWKKCFKYITKYKFKNVI